MDLAKLALHELAPDLMPEDATCGSARNATTSTRATLRRCRTREQGVALLSVGHAIEYLIHSRLIQQETTTDAERQALAILLAANLSVYNEGREVVPVIARIRRWFRGGDSSKTKTATIP